MRADEWDAIPEATGFLLAKGYVYAPTVYGILGVDEAQEILVGSLCAAKLPRDPEDFIGKVPIEQSLFHLCGRAEENGK